MDVRVIQSSEGNVAKYVFTEDDAVFESVLYRYPSYEERTVICCSTMSGCPIGCRFCGAGDYFVRVAKGHEIVEQVERCLADTGVDPLSMKRLQIMFMSMGEPMLNPKGMEYALTNLHELYPNAELLVSTMGPAVSYEWFFKISQRIPRIGLQFSVHETTSLARNKLIPFENKLTLDQISNVGRIWNGYTGRNPFFNYCAADHNTTDWDAMALSVLLPPDIWKATVSVICERNNGLPTRNEHQRELAANFAEKLIDHGFDVRVFDPAGQDDIGGGCGQLWFVQDWMAEHPELAKPSAGSGRGVVHTPGDLANAIRAARKAATGLEEPPTSKTGYA